MSEENVEIVRALWEPFKGINCAEIDWNAGAIREIIGQRYSTDAELRWSASGPDTHVYRGREGVVRALKEWVEPFSEYHAEVLDYISVGNRVVAPTRQWGTGRMSGAPVEIEVTHVYSFRDSEITRVDEYESLEDALEAAGLSE